MTDQKRRFEDQLPGQPLEWQGQQNPRTDEIRVERQQALLNCAAALLKAERAEASAVAFPGTAPEQYVMIGTADDILRLLPLPGATDGLLRAQMRDITTLLIERQNIDHLMNDPDLVRLLSALTTMAVNSAARSATPHAVAGKGEVPEGLNAAELEQFEQMDPPDAPTHYCIEVAMAWGSGWLDGYKASVLVHKRASLSSPAERHEAEALGTAWQPMETAPRDGTTILATNGKVVVTASYLYDEGYVREVRDADGRYIDQIESDGFDGWMDSEGGLPDLTHWMPMPSISQNVPLPAAPSSPSNENDLLNMLQVQAIIDTIKPGDGWGGDDWDFALANAVAAYMLRRTAASSPSVSCTVDTQTFRELLGWVIKQVGEPQQSFHRRNLIAHIDQHTAQAVRAAREEALQWISVDERLPEEGQSVLVSRFAGRVGNAEHPGHPGVPWVEVTRYLVNCAMFKCDLLSTGIVTHWMPLPRTPQSGVQGEKE